MVIHVGEFLDLAPAGNHLQSAGDSPADAQRVCHIAHHEVPRLVTRVDLAKQVLPRARRREEGAGCMVDAHRRAEGHELHQIAKLSQLGRDTRESLRLLLLCFLLKTVDGGVAAIDDEVGDALDLAPGKRLQSAGYSPNKPQRVDAVAHHDVPRSIAELGQAVDLVAR